MDAFTHFFVSLALWNILLATLAFLFGLLMGHWMWGQFKNQLLKTKAQLAESEKEVALYADDATELRDLNQEQEKSSSKDKEALGIELKSSRAALEETRTRASDSEKELATQKEENSVIRKSLSELEDRVITLSKDRDDAVKGLKEFKKKSSESKDNEEEWADEKERLRTQLSKEKSESASLREVISDLNDRERDLKKKLESLAEKDQKKDESKD